MNRVSGSPAQFALIVLLLLSGFIAAPAYAQTQASTQAPVQKQASTPPDIELEHRSARTEPEVVPPTIALAVPSGTPLEIAVDRELIVKRVGETVHGRVAEPVYAFDKLVIPAGAEAMGHITKIGKISAGHWVLEALNADFTPIRKIEVEFTEVILADGRHLPVKTKVTPGSGQLLNFVSSPGTNQKSGMVTQKTQEAKARAREQWNLAMHQVKSPGKVHRLKRYAIAQLPVHPQYIDAGIIYFAKLQEPVDFGREPLTKEMAGSLGELPQLGDVVDARLQTGLTSATNHKGDTVTAVVTQPLLENHDLIVPEGSVLSGTVVQVRPARRMSRNGQLRIDFRQLQLPSSVPQTIEANLESVEAGKLEAVKLDSEGGAHATTPKTRYLSTAVELGLAGLSARGDPDAKTPNAAGTTGNRMAGGLGGFKLVGVAAGIFVHSRVLGSSMGAYGAGMSVYAHFIARGRDVEFPKDTKMQIGLGSREPSLAKPVSGN